MAIELSPLKMLTPRESEVLRLLEKGLQNSEIAGLIGVSPHTAKAHVANLLRKLGVSNRTEAVGLLMAEEGIKTSVRPQDLPAITVMPFWRDGQSPEDRQQADGIVDDLITRLGRRWFPVIARCSSYALLQEGALDARVVGKELQARFLVEGDFRRVGDSLRMNVRLIDAENGHMLWGDTYDRRAGDLFDVQTEITAAIVTGVGNQVMKHLAYESAHIPAPELQPWELAVRGMSLFWRGTKAENQNARALFQKSIEGAPQVRLGLYGTALTFQREIVEQWGEDIRVSAGTLYQLSEQFLGMHPDDAWANLMSAYATVYVGDRPRAFEHVRNALVQEPSSLRARSLHGQLLAMEGEVAPAIEQLKIALRLSPRSPNRWSLECAVALAHFADEDYESGITWA